MKNVVWDSAEQEVIRDFFIPVLFTLPPSPTPIPVKPQGRVAGLAGSDSIPRRCRPEQPLTLTMPRQYLQTILLVDKPDYLGSFSTIWETKQVQSANWWDLCIPLIKNLEVNLENKAVSWDRADLLLYLVWDEPLSTGVKLLRSGEPPDLSQPQEETDGSGIW